MYENDPTVSSFRVRSSGNSFSLRHVFRVLYPGEGDSEAGPSCSPELVCKAGRAGGGGVEPPADGGYAQLALDHVLRGSQGGAAGRFISTTASLGVAQRFSGQLFAPVALIFLGDMPDEAGGAPGRIQNLTLDSHRRSVDRRI